MRFDFLCARTTQDAAPVLAQIREGGCNEIITTFALALAAIFHGQKPANFLQARQRVRT
jgi:hypothetical protein